MDAVAILNTITAALLLGAGKLLLDVKMAVAVLENETRHHAAKIKEIEERPTCPHLPH